MNIELDPEILEVFKASSSISTHKGSATGLLKIGSKRRRTRAEIDELREEQDALRQALGRALPPDPRPNMKLLFAGGQQSKRRSSLKVQRMVQSLSWRTQYSLAEFYPMEVNGVPFKVKQLKQGELRGLGTGATVWPAAYMLIKYLEHS